MDYLKHLTFACVLLGAINSAAAQTPTIASTSDALNYVLSDDRVPNSEVVKLEFVKTTFSKKGRHWEFEFRDGENIYQTKLTEDGKFKFKKKVDARNNHPEFWASIAMPKEVSTPEAYFEKAKTVVTQFNSKMRPTGRAMVKYEVCDPPVDAGESRYANGCRIDKAKETWTVYLQIVMPKGDQEDKHFKAITFEDGEPASLTRGQVFGNW